MTAENQIPAPAQPRRMNSGDWAQLLTLRDVMKTAYKRGGDRLMSVWERDLNALEAAIALLDPAAQPPAAPVETAPDVKDALDFIEMADNRLDCVDCPECVELARSYLKEAIAHLRRQVSRPQSSAANAQAADKLDAIFDRIEVSCDWRLSSEERQHIAEAAKLLRAAPQRSGEPSYVSDPDKTFDLLSRLRDYLVINMRPGNDLAPKFIREIDASLSLPRPHGGVDK